MVQETFKYLPPIYAHVMLQAVDLFSGAGGFSEGLAQAGFRNLLGVDSNQTAIETYRHNHSSVGLHDTLTQDTELPVAPRQVELVAGGPPCQGFSNAGDKNYDEDNRNNLVGVFADLALSLDPEFVVMENVKPFPTIEDGAYLESVTEPLEDAGYSIEYGVLDATDYGIAQTRERFFLVASQRYTPSLPEPTTPKLDVSCKTVFENVDGLPNHSVPNHSDEAIGRMDELSYGEPYYDDHKYPSRLDPYEPAYTIRASTHAQAVHPHENRFISPRECARLQTFPDYFEFLGNKTEQFRQIGNAVPPELAYQIAEELKTLGLQR